MTNPKIVPLTWECGEYDCIKRSVCSHVAYKDGSLYWYVPELRVENKLLICVDILKKERAR